ncbi:hypothetical protein SLA2020_445230 [Shorea laevis]
MGFTRQWRRTLGQEVLEGSYKQFFRGAKRFQVAERKYLSINYKSSNIFSSCQQKARKVYRNVKFCGTLGHYDFTLRAFSSPLNCDPQSTAIDSGKELP